MSKAHLRAIGLYLWLGLIFFLNSGVSHATTYKWVGKGGTLDWLNVTNWLPQGIPTLLDTVIVDNSVITLTTNVQVQSLTLTNSLLQGIGNLTVTDSFLIRDSKLTGLGTFTIGPQATGEFQSAELTTDAENFIGRPVSNYGVIQWQSGKLALGANLQNQSGAVIEINCDRNLRRSDTLLLQPAFYNDGEVVKNLGTGQTRLGSAFINRGILTARQGCLDFGTSFQQTAGQTVLAGGSLKTEGSTMKYSGGILRGNGLIEGNVLNEGTDVTIGNSPGTITISGNYTQTGNGTLQMEIGGANPGTGYDQLIVNGTANLGGTIELVQYNNYVPPVGSSYKLLTYYSVSGSFATFKGLYPGDQRYYTTTKAPSYFLAAVSGDTTAPAITFKAPVSNGTYNTLKSCSGTASDSGSGLSSVTVMLYRKGNGKLPAGYWAGGTSWTSTYSAVNERPVSGTSSWSLSLPTPTPMGFTIRATATDRAGNKQCTSNLVYANGSVTTSSVSAFSNARLQLTPNQLSTAAASRGSDSVILTFQGPLDPTSTDELSNYQVSVNGTPAEVESVLYQPGSNRLGLQLPAESLASGTSVFVEWDGLRDLQGNELSGRTGVAISQ